MNSNDVREGSTKAKFNEQNSSIFIFEIITISVAVGFYYDSWIYFGIIFISLFVLSTIKPLAFILGISLGLLWGIIGYLVGSYFSQQASVVLAVIFLLVGIGVNLSAMQWVSDITK